MTILIIILSVVIILLFAFILWQSHTQKNLITSLQSSLSVQQQSFITDNTRNEEKLKEVHETLMKTSQLQENMRGITDTLTSLSKESYQSSQMTQVISERIHDMNNIMVNKKSRGNWGEYQLNNLLSVYAGDNQNIFKTQYSLKNGYIGDVALILPRDERVLIIDSKFPLENYQNLTDENISESEFIKYLGLFKQNIKKHINDISHKYITLETVENAVMFIPSESIYSYICGECPELIDYAHSKHILMTSPTTLLGVVFTLVSITKDFHRSKNIKALEKDIVSMYKDVERFQTRMTNMEGLYRRLGDSFKEAQTSGEKISKRIERIYDGYEPEDTDV